MVLSFVMFLALWGFVHQYNKEYAPDIKLRIKDEFNKRLELFWKELVEKYGTVEEQTEDKDFGVSFTEKDSARKDFKDFVEKSRKVFTAETVVARLDFVDKYFYQFTVLLLPSIFSFSARQLLCFKWCKSINLSYPIIKTILLQMEGAANIILLVMLSWYMWQFFRVRNLRDGL